VPLTTLPPSPPAVPLTTLPPSPPAVPLTTLPPSPPAVPLTTLPPSPPAVPLTTLPPSPPMVPLTTTPPMPPSTPVFIAPAPPNESDYYSLLSITLSFFAMMALFGAAIWGAGELRRRRRLRQQRADAEYLLGVTGSAAPIGLQEVDDATRDYAPHNDF